MKIVLKRIACFCCSLLMLFAVLFAAFSSIGFALPSTSASAESLPSEGNGLTVVDDERNKLRMDENKIWEWKFGAAIEKDFDESGEFQGSSLLYTAYLRSKDIYEGFLNGNQDTMQTVFTVYREDEHGRVAVYEYLVYSFCSDSYITTLCMHRSLAYAGSAAEIQFYVLGDLLGNYERVILPGQKDFSTYEILAANEFDAVLEEVGVMKKSSTSKPMDLNVTKTSDYPWIGFFFKPQSFKTFYSMGINYSYKDWKKKVWYPIVGNTNIYDKTEGSCLSNIRSQYYILNAIYEAGQLEYEFGDQSDKVLEALAACENPTKIQIKYLAPIANTVFCREVTATIHVPMFGGKIFYDDVCQALGLETLSVLGSSWKDFVYNEAELAYVTEYLEAVYLTARTTDGNTTDAGSEAGSKYFLDLNLSYEEYYYGFVESKIFTEDVYEYFLNMIKRRYSVLEGVEASDIHGYFGYIAIPEAHTFNSAWASMFNTEKSVIGGIVHFEHTNNLTKAAYNALLNEYQYNFLERAWANLAGDFLDEYPATHYVFYTDGVDERAGMLENGATDLDSEMGAAATDVVETTSKIVSTTASAIGTIWSEMDLGPKIGTALAIVLVVVLVGLAIYGIIKLKMFTGF